tara:strand:- start:16963 stop:18003 length:1041 start_codon:yes stop_codon:yes gene_type:complete
MKETLTDLIKLYRKRGASLRNQVNPLINKSGLITQASWNNTFTHLEQYEESEITRDQFSVAIEDFRKDLFSKILYDNKFISIINKPSNYQEIKNCLEDFTFESFDKVNASNLIEEEDEDFCYKSISNSTTTYIFKKIRKYSVKEDLKVSALKLEYQNDGYDKLFAYVDISLPCFDSIMMDDEREIIILAADLSSIFQVDHLRGAVASLKTIIRQGTPEDIKVTDKNTNFFAAIQKFYEEDLGNVKELAFKTDDGVAHYENAKRGISCIKDGDFHIGGTDVADIEAYKIRKTYSAAEPSQENSVYLVSSWYVLNGNLGERKLGEATISASSHREFFVIIDKLLNWSK